MKTLLVIPARLESTRLPRKLLLSDTGKPLIQHTFESAQKSLLANKIVIAADAPEMVAVCSTFSADVVLTGDHPTGTDRVAEIASLNPDFDIVINVQGDEPEVEAGAIDAAIQLLIDHPAAVASTLATPIRQQSLIDDSACVKVVMDNQSRAIWFSRSPLPFVRDVEQDWLNLEPPIFHQHVGLYGYRRDFLLQLSQMPQTDIERAESLEQLRILEAGFELRVAVVSAAAPGIDTLNDYRAFVSRWTS